MDPKFCDLHGTMHPADELKTNVLCHSISQIFREKKLYQNAAMASLPIRMH